MYKKLSTLMVAVFMVIGIGSLLCSFTWATVNTDVLRFMGKDNTEITLLADKQDFIQRNRDKVNESESENLEVGQVIVSGGVEEIVFAIGEDGSYITIPSSK